MKLNFGILCGVLLSTSLVAQTATNAPAPAAASIETPAASPALTNAAPAAAPAATLAAPAAPQAKASAEQAPAKKKTAPKKKAPAKKAVAKKAPGAALKTVPLLPGPATVVASNVNVRGQAKLKSEVVAKITKEQQVTVIEEIVNNNSAADEPSAWAKIVLPPGAHTWINTAYIDAATKAVKPRKLNVRSGAGENFSVIGQLLKGEQVKELGAKGDWTEIEAPTNAYAFVAAQFLRQEAAATPAIAVATPPETPLSTNAVTEAPMVAAAPADVPAVTNPPTETAATPAISTTPTEPAATDTNAPAIEEPPPKRVVMREGIVKGTGSIQAPTSFALYSPETGRIMDYLFTSSGELDLRRYKGLRIIVTGEEGLEDRWGNTPVITIQQIHVVE